MYGGGGEGQDPRGHPQYQYPGRMDSSSGQGQVQGPGPQQKYQFNPDEIRVLKECNRESFYYRCLPLGTLLGVGAYYGVRMGYLKPSARYGAGPKMFVGSILGYFLGKFSYQSKCVEKLMQIPNSPLADMLRKQKGRVGFQETLSMEPGFATASPAVMGGPAFPDSEYAVKEPGNFTDVSDTRPMTSFDTETSTFTGFDYGKYDTTQQMSEDSLDKLPQRRTPNTSYDDLRRMNRDEFEHKVHSPRQSFEGQQRPAPSPYQQQQSPPVRGDTSSRGRPQKNVYGDEWDDKVQ